MGSGSKRSSKSSKANHMSGMWILGGFTLFAVIAVLALAITDVVFTVETYNKVKNQSSEDECETSVITYYDFVDPTGSLTNPPFGMSFFTYGNFTGNNGNITLKDGYSQLLSSPYTLTVPQGDTGGLDHVKWLSYVNRTYPLSVYQETICSAKMSVQTTGVSSQPFGTLVQNPDADIRLAGAALTTVDPYTYITADFFMTNTKIYALYERLPFGRTDLYNYAAFTFAIPIADRSPDDYHTLAIGYNLQLQYIRWILDGIEVFRVDTVGMLITRQYMLVDYGGQEETLFPQNIQCGFGTFSIMDGYAPCVAKEFNAGFAQQCTFSSTQDYGLVQLSNSTDYLDPRTGMAPAMFNNTAGAQSSKLFGQGAIMNIENLQVYTQKDC